MRAQIAREMYSGSIEYREALVWDQYQNMIMTNFELCKRFNDNQIDDNTVFS